MTSPRKHKPESLMGACLLPVVLLLLEGCDKQAAFHSFKSIPAEGWQLQDTVCFEVVVPDTLPVTYALSVEVRNTNDYPYRNLELSATVNHAGTLHTDTLQFTLATSKGRWTGKGWGNLYQSAIPAGETVLHRADTCQVRIAYVLPDPILHGITDIGILLSRQP